MKIKLQPASATDLPAYNPILPAAAITQVMLIALPAQVSESDDFSSYMLLIQGALVVTYVTAPYKLLYYYHYYHYYYYYYYVNQFRAVMSESKRKSERRPFPQESVGG